MVLVFKFRYLLTAAISLLLFLFSATSLAEGSIVLRVFNQGIKPIEFESHQARRQALACNVTDKTSNDYDLTNWKLPSNVTYQLNLFSAPSSVRSNLATIVGNSFGTWSPLTKGVSLTRGTATSASRARFDSQNIIAWNFLSRSVLGVTYIWYNPDSNYVVEVDTILNSRHPWGWTDPKSINVDQTCPPTNAYDAQNILTHELGHWFGLDDLYNSTDEDLTMYGYGAKQELKKDTLEFGDKAGVANIYP